MRQAVRLQRRASRLDAAKTSRHRTCVVHAANRRTAGTARPGLPSHVRRFFWASGSGCSCNSWGEDLRTEGDFENGDKLGLQRSIRQLAEEYPYSVSATDVLDAVGAVATFRTVPNAEG